MKRLVIFGATMLVWLSLSASSAMAQGSTFTARAVGCGTQFAGDPNHYTGLTGTITPVPSTDFDISAVSSLQGEVFHISLPAFFDITGITVFARLPLGVVTVTAFQDLNNNDVQDSGEPTIASTRLNRPCEPQRTEECKNGAWRDFPFLTFKNQGDCVSYVATGGKNPPGP